MHIVKGRKYEADSLWTSANLSKVDLQGGNEQNYDSIFIDDDTMAYNLTVNVASHTKIQNNAVNGSTNNTVRIRNSSKKFPTYLYLILNIGTLLQ
uniref:Uncharacterized protein n=1 Tax=Romanomermis culicivorax TaxID=13658 RepID=A0A915JRC4_ROMCU